MIGKFLLGVAVSSGILMFMVTFGLWLAAVLEGGDALTAGRAVFGHASFFVVFFGLPLSATVTALVGGVFLALENRRGKPLSLYARYAVPTALGAASFPLVWWWFWGRPFLVSLWIALGALAGCIGGLSFWRILENRGVPLPPSLR